MSVELDGKPSDEELIKKFYDYHNKMTTDVDICHERWCKRIEKMNKRDVNEISARRKLGI